jgi:hypothetical protein
MVVSERTQFDVYVHPTPETGQSRSVCVQPVSVSIMVTTTGTGIVTVMLSTVRSDSRRCNERCTIATVTVQMNQTYVPSIEYSSSLHLQLPLLSIYNYLSSPSTTTSPLHLLLKDLAVCYGQSVGDVSTLWMIQITVLGL